jgi:hypothetical protein
MPGSESVPWSKAPENDEKRLLWREEMAGEILFAKAFQACGKHHTSAFVEKFFGSSAVQPVVSNVKPVATVPVTMQKAKKTTQSTLSNFMVDQFLVKTIEKKQRLKKREESKESKEEPSEVVKPKVKASLKNEIVNP